MCIVIVLAPFPNLSEWHYYLLCCPKPFFLASQEVLLIPFVVSPDTGRPASICCPLVAIQGVGGPPKKQLFEAFEVTHATWDMAHEAWWLDEVWPFLDLEATWRVKDIEHLLTSQFISYFSTLSVVIAVLPGMKGVYLIPSSICRLQHIKSYLFSLSQALHHTLNITKP